MFIPRIFLWAAIWTMRFEALEWAALNAAEADEREHVVPYIIKHPDILRSSPWLSRLALQRPDLRITVDTMEDYNFMYRLYYHFRNSEMKDVPWRYHRVLGRKGK
jgi:spore coat polysaccharide biosynthesis protein SpsF